MVFAQYLLSPWALLAAVVLYYAWPYFVTYRHIRDIPGPLTARLSNWWLLSTARRGKRYEIVDEAHKKYGPVMRIQPNHVSINDDEAIQAIYGHGNGFLKAEYYDAFVSIQRGLFNTRSRQDHSRKRKMVSHTFSKSVGQFEPYMHSNLQLFVQRWDAMLSSSATARVDCLDWFNFIAFDIIGDLAFGAPFGMLRAGADVAEIRRSSTDPEAPPEYAPAVEILNRRGEVSATLGCLPALQPFAAWLPDPFFHKGVTAVRDLAGIAVARVRRRLEQGEGERKEDLLARLMEGRDEKGQPLGRDELTAEALTQLIAGSDTTSNSSCALLYHAVRTPGVIEKLREELDAAVPTDVPVPNFEQIKDLPYLQAVINEALRHHSTSGIGLPRVVPPQSGGVEIKGHYFPPGTTLSVPTYSIHHSREIWGPDADEFRPERWEKVTDRQKNAFIPFSYGPRACIGRNVADMELKLIVATWVRRYDVVLRQDELLTSEGFLRKPLGLDIEFKRREV
ncbi:hypothetical protein ACRALDRAFT_2025126 [Sodiomyces alcalophilus JCM 7366]|uniref:uncharacterized protein n=1 Tax=Sodiomyces alcalophilus JCM 7366 TaxID=591952 RepID=UPI0039B44C1E